MGRLEDGWVEIDIPDDVKDDETRFLRFVNPILAKTRRNAWDHESPEADSGAIFHAGTLIKTKSGKYFASPNIQLPNSKTARQCAENLATTSAVKVEGFDKMEISDLYFMGGKGNLKQHMDIIPTHFGKRFSPCGSCRDVIWNSRLRLDWSVTQQTKIHMLPLNNGEWYLIPDDGRADDAEWENNRVMTRTINQLLPHVTRLFEDADNTLKPTLAKAWEYINDRNTLQAMTQAFEQEALTHLSGMKDQLFNDVARKVNDLMMDTVKHMYLESINPEKSAQQPKRIDIAVVRMSNGEFYLGAFLDNGKILGLNSAGLDAIQDAKIIRPNADDKITDVFFMQLDCDKMPTLMEQWKDKTDAPVEVRMPDGDTRDRISKAGPNAQEFIDLFGKYIDDKTGANIHIILPNNKQDFDPTKHLHTMPLAELYPYRYISPKIEQEVGK